VQMNDLTAASEGQTPPPDGEPQQGQPEAPVAPDQRTLEEVMAELEETKARLSGKDRAYSELDLKFKTLKQDVESKQTVERGQTQQASEAEAALRQQVADLQRQLEESARIKTAEVRSVRFPKATESLGADVVATMDEERLASLEQRLGGTAPAPVMASVAPARSITAPPPPRDKTTDELKADLKRYEAEFLASL